MNKLKNFGYWRVTLILLVIVIIYTVAIPTNTRTSLIRLLLILAFICSFVCWIYYRITTKKKHIQEINTSEEVEKKEELYEEKKSERKIDDLKSKENFNWIKDLFNQFIGFISWIKPWLWAVIFFVLWIILLWLWWDWSYSVVTWWWLCFICRCLWAIIYMHKKSKNREIASRESEKKALEIAESIKNWTYPDINVDIPVDADEKVYWVYNASMIKEKTVRSTTSFWWPTASIKIMKWVRYRVWSINHQTESSKQAYNYDYGKLYVTTKRFIYVGDKETDTIKAKDMMKLSVAWDNIYIYKQKWKPARYQLSWDITTFIWVMQWLNHM